VSIPSLLTGLLLSALPAADVLSREELQERAESAFHQGVEARNDPVTARQRFREAAGYYEQLRQHGTPTAALYCNQGNAYLLAGDLARAILAYRRGLQLDPNHPELHRRLAYARAQVAYPPDGTFRPPSDPWPSGLAWLPHPTPAPLLGLALLLYSLGCLCLTRWRMTRRSLLLGLGIGALIAALLPTAGWGLLVWLDRQEIARPLVVIATEKVPLRQGNGPDYPIRRELPRGVEARQRFVRRDAQQREWLQIELANGEVGWVTRAAVVCAQP
jgi:tetratricopeptide (TPR) repeat protein